MTRARLQHRHPQGFDWNENPQDFNFNGNPQAFDYNEDPRDYFDEPPYRRPSPAEISSVMSARSSAREREMAAAAAASSAAEAAGERTNALDMDVPARTTTAPAGDIEASATMMSDSALEESIPRESSSAKATNTPVVGDAITPIIPAEETNDYSLTTPTDTGRQDVHTTLDTFSQTNYVKGTPYPDIHTDDSTIPDPTHLISNTDFSDTSRAQRANSDPIATGSLVAAVVIPILALLAILLFALLCLRRRRRRNFDSNHHGEATYTGASGFLPALKEKFSFSSPNSNTPKTPQMRARNHIGPAAIAYGHSLRHRESMQLQQATAANTARAATPPPMMSTNAHAYYTGLATSTSTSARESGEGGSGGGGGNSAAYAPGMPLQRSDGSGGTVTLGRRSEGGTTFVEPPPPYFAQQPRQPQHDDADEEVEAHARQTGGEEVRAQQAHTEHLHPSDPHTSEPQPSEAPSTSRAHATSPSLGLSAYTLPPTNGIGEPFDPFGDHNAAEPPLSDTTEVAAGGDLPARMNTQRSALSGFSAFSEVSVSSTLYSEGASVGVARVGRGRGSLGRGLVLGGAWGEGDRLGDAGDVAGDGSGEDDVGVADGHRAEGRVEGQDVNRMRDPFIDREGPR